MSSGNFDCFTYAKTYEEEHNYEKGGALPIHGTNAGSEGILQAVMRFKILITLIYHAEVPIPHFNAL